MVTTPISGLVTTVMMAVCATGAPVLGQAGDYNGDGRDDLAIGSPNDSETGGLNVLYGRGGGLKATGDQYFTKETPGFAGNEIYADHAFWSLASGDFNGDGFSDLAAGSPREDVGGTNGAGVVNVLYGDDDGLSLAGDQLWHAGVAGVKGEVSSSADFGSAVAAGDFDGDGFDDLAISAVGEEFGSVAGGVVHILYGSADGLTAAGDQLFAQSSPGIADVSEEFDSFGDVLASGDFDGDGRDDLAIGIENEEVDGIDDAGAVAVLYGSSNGLSAAGDQFWHLNVPGVQGVATISDDFGFAIAAGDFDGDGHDDLAIGIREASTGGVNDTGAVLVLYGSSGAGLSAAGDQFWTQDSTGVQDAGEEQDQIGHALAAGDFDGDGRDDLAIGIPTEDVEATEDAGAVAVLYGVPNGLSGAGDQFLHRDVAGVAGSANTGDRFGVVLYAGDFNGDGRDDLGVVTSVEVVDGVDYAGTVTVFYGKGGGGGSGGGLSLTGEQVWSQNSPGVQGVCEEFDLFGELRQPGP